MLSRHKVSFTAITLVSDIHTELTITGAKSGPAVITAHTEDDRLAAGPEATIESLEKALAAYRTEAIAKLAAMKS